MRALSLVKTKQASQPDSSSARPRAKRGVGAGSIVLLLFLAYGYFIPRGAMWNADTRLFLAASIVDDGSITLDRYAPYTGDIASSGGHYYSDKAPGSSLLAVPVYAFVKLVLYRGQTNYANLLSTDEKQ